MQTFDPRDQEPKVVAPGLIFRNIKSGSLIRFSRRIDITDLMDGLGEEDLYWALFYKNAYARGCLTFDIESDNGRFYLVIATPEN